MAPAIGWTAFVLIPIGLAVVLLRLDPRVRRVRGRSIVLYLVVMSLLIYGALRLVAAIASARVIPVEIAIVLWFTIGWRLAWAIWLRTVGRLGQRWGRWTRLQRRAKRPVPWRFRLIPVGRATLTATLFFPAFLSMVVTHRCKLADGETPSSLFYLPYESVRIPTSDGLTLDGWFIPQDRARRTIVICHGAGANKGNFVPFLGPLLDRGYNVLFFDFRAHGASGGRVTTYGLTEQNDVLAAVAWLKRERPAACEKIVGLGSSQGAMALALAAAREPRIDAIVLDSPFISPLALATGNASVVPVIGPAAAKYMLLLMSLQTGVDFFSPSAEEAVRQLGQRPLFVVHGRDDIIMPASHTQRLYDAASGPRAIWFGPGPHSNIITTAPGEYGERLFAFLDQHLGPVPRESARPRRSRSSAPASAPN